VIIDKPEMKVIFNQKKKDPLSFYICGYLLLELFTKLWQIGEKILKSGEFEAIFPMKNPSHM
jgi:hypothetical protein